MSWGFPCTSSLTVQSPTQSARPQYNHKAGHREEGETQSNRHWKGQSKQKAEEYTEANIEEGEQEEDW